MPYNFPNAIARYNRMKDEAMIRMYQKKMRNENFDDELKDIRFCEIMLRKIRDRRRWEIQRERRRRKNGNE